MRFGYRVHKLELARGLRGRRLLDPKTCTNQYEIDEAKKGSGDKYSSQDYLDYLVAQLQSFAKSEDALTDFPKLLIHHEGRDAFVANTESGTPRLLVHESTVVGRRVDVLVEYGHLGWHDRAIGAKRADALALANRSPMQRFRISFLVPTVGQTGLIVSESISGTHALPVLVAWLNHESRLPETGGDEGMIRLMAHPLTDIDRVLELLSSDAVAEMELTRVSAKTKDGTPTSGKISLKEQLVPGGKVDKIKVLLNKWQEANFVYDNQGKKDQVAAMAEIIGISDSDLEFTDGVIRIDPADGKRVSVRPSKLGELYAYEISDVRPSPKAWTKAVSGKVAAIATGQGLKVSW